MVGKRVLRVEGSEMVRRFRLKTVWAIALLLILAGCGRNSSWATYGLFTKPELRAYDRFAVFGLDPEQEQIFMAEYVGAFSGRNVTFVERQRITGVISEQDFLRGRLKGNTRAKLQEIYGVEALIICEYTHGMPGAATEDKKLRIRILDTETAAIVGSVVVSKTSLQAGSDQADFMRAVEEAVRGLKEHVSGVGFY